MSGRMRGTYGCGRRGTYVERLYDRGVVCPAALPGVLIDVDTLLD